MNTKYIDIDEALLRAYRQNDDVAFYAMIQELLNRSAFLPSHLHQHVARWLASNDKQPEQVRWGMFPLGMVQRWIERAEKSESNAPPALDPVTAAMRDPRWGNYGFENWLVQPSLSEIIVYRQSHLGWHVVATGPDAPSACQAAIAGVGPLKENTDART